MWLAFETLENSNTHAINGQKYFVSPPLLLRRGGGRPPRRSPGPPVLIAARAGRLTSRRSWQTGSRNNPLVMNINKPIPVLTRLPSAGPWTNTTTLKFTLSACPSGPMAPLLGSGLLSSPARATALSENRGHCLNCREDAHSPKQCRHAFQNLTGILNPDLGTLDDDGEASRRWQKRIVLYLRDNKSPRPNRQHNKKKTKSTASAIRVGSTSARASRTNKATTTTHARNEDIYQQSNSGHRGGGPTAPASSTSAPASGIRYGASHNSAGNPNGRQPGIFLASDTDRSTAVRPLPPVRRQHCREKKYWAHKMLVSQARPALSAERALRATPYCGPTQRPSLAFFTGEPPGVFPGVGSPRFKRRSPKPRTAQHHDCRAGASFFSAGVSLPAVPWRSV